MSFLLMGTPHMSRITKIEHHSDRDRYWIYVDGEYCCSIRGRTFPAMGLHVGQDIDCAEIEALEKFHWKNAYGQAAWDKEKVRLDRIKAMIEDFDPRLSVQVTGFGATTNEFIAHHPKEPGKPDLEVIVKGGNRLLAAVEVTGTEHFRGGNPRTYWVRPDKLAYAKNHSDQDVWIVLHYAEPEELIVAIKPDIAKKYLVKEITIREAIEHYVVFSDNDPERVALDVFAQYLISQI
ncbi:hypothetical protein [Xanthomonas campestris]|uniref:hypothetical protein n=1 Tax=Xanthomonas campestris TaxID=339 RepID=UPI001C6EB390|nr:hypothetical protein [Xanthomonas campestris]MEA0969649.1 hypothetical protein [Xanthomonas campestris pv. campestris]